MKALQLRSFGPVTESVALVDLETPIPGPGQVLVDLEAATINPSDLMQIAGQYAIRPALPAALGDEGVGRVSALGADVDTLNVGDRVLVLPTVDEGTWREQVVVDVRSLVRVDPDADPLQLAQLGINPITAELLLRYGSLKPGAWIGQTAGNSAVGAYVIALAKRAGFRTLSIVRRPEVVPSMLAAGADAVLLDGEDVDAALGGDKLSLVLDPVGGEQVNQLVAALETSGTVVSYGSLTKQPLVIPPAKLISGDVTLQGFWLINWFRSASAEEIAEAYGRLAKLTVDGTLYSPVSAVHKLDDFQKAIGDTANYGRGGKILFTF